MPSAPGDDDLTAGAAAGSSRRMVAMPASAGSMSIPAAAMTVGIEPRVAMPMPPQAVQSMTMPRTSGRVRRRLDVSLHSRSFAAE